MKYTEEEKKAIEVAKEIVDKKYGSIMIFEIRDMEKILNLLDKQQKEIERLKEHLNQYNEGKLFTSNQLKRIEKEQNKYYIHKDKIREKIEEIEKLIKECFIDEEHCHEIPLYKYEIQILKELLGE